MRSVKEFEATLIDRLRSVELRSDILNEGDLERRPVLPVVQELLKQAAGPHVYAHPWNQHDKCAPNCSDGSGLVEGSQLHGCPDCWKQSKTWAAVHLYGVHCFDFVVGSRGDSFALELKLLRSAREGRRRANGEFQRFLGQCMLAKLVHPRTIGFCVAEAGALDWSAKDHVAALDVQGITLIVRELSKSRSQRPANNTLQRSGARGARSGR